MTASSKRPTALLLVNLGTPDSPSVPDVRRYLREFLMDPYVLDINALGRWALVHGIILPFRPKKSAEAYSSIWTERGSPLRFHTEDLATGVRAKVKTEGLDLEVAWGMRYGNPSSTEALEDLYRRGHREILVLPLYPQYALSSTETGIQQLKSFSSTLDGNLSLTFVPPFYSHAGFLEAEAAVIKRHLDEHQPDFLLMSYHGLPVRHVQKTAKPEAQCSISKDCCAQITEYNSNCYRAQCYETSRQILKRVQWPDEKSLTTFQSRLGRTPWIQPYTDVGLPKLAQAGVKNLAVACPAFVADCLETLEEIGDRAQHDFVAAGGKSLRLIPSLNSEPIWVDGVVKIARDFL